MKIAVASDHAGYKMKVDLKKYLQDKGHTTVDFGSESEESVDYADYAHPLAVSVENNDVDFGISLCGSGNGINITVNKHQGVRSALCWTPEIARLAKEHNNANVVALPARFINTEEAKQIIEAYLNASFEGGRHQNRIDKIPIK